MPTQGLRGRRRRWAPAPGCLGHQACALQGGLGPGVAPGEAMVGAEMVVEVLDRPARMAGSVLLEHPFDPVGRHAARGRLVEPSVEQSVQAIVLVAAPGSGGSSARSSPASPPPPAQTGVVPASAPAHSETSASCVPVATSSGSSRSLPTERPNRTTRVLPNPDTSCASDIEQPKALTRGLPWSLVHERGDLSDRLAATINKRAKRSKGGTPASAAGVFAYGAEGTRAEVGTRDPAGAWRDRSLASRRDQRGALPDLGLCLRHGRAGQRAHGGRRGGLRLRALRQSHHHHVRGSPRVDRGRGRLPRRRRAAWRRSSRRS